MDSITVDILVLGWGKAGKTLAGVEQLLTGSTPLDCVGGLD